MDLKALPSGSFNFVSLFFYYSTNLSNAFISSGSSDPDLPPFPFLILDLEPALRIDAYEPPGIESLSNSPGFIEATLLCLSN